MKRVLGVLLSVVLFSSVSWGFLDMGVYSEFYASYSKWSDGFWKIDQGAGNLQSYFELKFNGAYAGWNFWTKAGATVYRGSTSDSLSSWEAHIQKRSEGKTGYEVVFYMNESRLWLEQPLLSFTGSVGDSSTKAGVYWNLWNYWGLYFKGFLIDYKDDDKITSWGTKHETGFGNRITTSLNLGDITMNLGTTWIFELYRHNDESITPVWGYETNRINGLYRAIGADVSITVPLTFLPGSSFFFATEVGNSYSPENMSSTYEEDVSRWKMFLRGDDKSYIYKTVLKLGLSTDLGNFSIDSYIYGAQPNWMSYLGGAGNNWFEEFFQITYMFPIKAIDFKSYIKYSHVYDWPQEDFHVWGYDKPNFDTDQTLEVGSEVNIEFKKGFRFKVFNQKVEGKDYLQSKGYWDHLLAEMTVENEFARIKPQFKIYYLGDDERQMTAYGLETLVNITDWLKFYARYALVNGSQVYKSQNGHDSWQNFFGQLQVYPANNTQIFLEYGDGGGTDNDLVNDADLIKNGLESVNKIKLTTKFWF